MKIKRGWQVAKNFYHYGQSYWWRAWYGWPDRRLKIYGVTGTNGKTTTSVLLAKILRQKYGKNKVGLFSTIVFWYGAEEVINDAKMTTLPSKIVWRDLRRLVDQGVEQVVLEITSHSLDQNRLAGLSFRGAIILNLYREHLDYHGTMKAYAAAKEKIINYLKPGAVLVGKKDDKWVGPILRRAQRQGLAVKTFTSQEARQYKTPLEGGVNQENVAAATLLAQAIGLNQKNIQTAVAELTSVPGRMEWVKEGGKQVLIDYAVTPDALERLYRELKPKVAGRLLAVFGVMGERDRGKRAQMTRLVAQYADEIILTREDPQREPEEQIFADLEQGLVDSAVPWQRVVDRREAIRLALRRATENDVVILTGKGAEVGMIVGTRKIPWNDKQVVRELISELSA